MEAMGEAEEELESWEEVERNEETLRILGKWWTLRNETDISANISRQYKLIRQAQRKQRLELKEPLETGLRAVRMSI